MWRLYFTPTTIDEALTLLDRDAPRARIIAGGTDLLLELERGQRPGVDTLIDITRIPGLDRITLDDQGWIHIGPRVTHNQVLASDLLRDRAFPLVRASWEVGSPALRNRATVAGNILTASPANDTIAPLMALGARVTLRSAHSQRTVPLAEFYTGVRRTVMQPNEMLVDIAIPALGPRQRGTFRKLGLRKAQAIAVVNVAVVLTWAEDGETVEDAAITLGAVAPTIVHATEAEAYLRGRRLTPEVIAEAARLAVRSARPIDDIRGSAAYRRRMVEVYTRRALQALAQGDVSHEVPARPPLLWGQTPPQPRPLPVSASHPPDEIVARINGRVMVFRDAEGKTLLDLLRDHALLTGTKEGCGEGECGACTVHLDGAAVLSCLVPAARAHGADIVTVEGLVQAEHLHPVQEAFVHDHAVQCGYCTPGFVMAAAKLIEEHPHPDRETIAHGLSGNLCRCTGYYKIFDAVAHAAALARGEDAPHEGQA
ncbi:MAG: 2Fe-2S iron-sulfur cluster binding domain-containing protein [Chloroflexi bacterium]|nr:2Fe-2S iron-sulfur cluster binding domain-containing protein [Chloroflexota bacterium]